MKKLVSVLLAAGLVASMTACGGGDKKESAAAPAETTAAAAETTKQTKKRQKSYRSSYRSRQGFSRRRRDLRIILYIRRYIYLQRAFRTGCSS